MSLDSTKALLKKVREIEIKTRALSDEVFAGAFHSAFKGSGVSFSEIRPYQYGDEIRTIDWKVSAKLQEPHIKIFDEERELTVMLLVDISASNLLGTSTLTKRQYITEICALIAFSAMKSGDKVGLMFFSDDIQHYVPPKKGKKHILGIIRSLLTVKEQKGKTDVSKALIEFGNIIKKRSIAFLISDFFADNYSKPLRITKRKHDLIGLRVLDPLESHFPKLGLIKLNNPESDDELWFDSSNPKARKAMDEHLQKFKTQFLESFKKASADSLELNSNENYTKNLLSFFKSRT